MFKRWYYVITFIVLSLSLNSIFAIDEVNDLSGKIAIIGTDYNIYTYIADANEQIQLTQDASADRRYQFPTWSTDGRLAYFCCEASPNAQAHISANGEATGNILYENEGAFILYAYWSPADCGTNCRELAMLTSDALGLSVDVLQDSNTPSTTKIGSGGPFYYHWDSTGTQMIFHRGNSDLDIYNRTQDDISGSLENSSGTFQTPVWSPIDDRILIGMGNPSGNTDLATIEDGEASVLVSDISGLLAFLWSPDGRYIAYRTLDQFGFSGLTVVDAETGEIVIEDQSTSAISFFWSPDSKKIAYISLSEVDNSRSASLGIHVSQNFVQNDSPTQFVWNVLDIEAETNLSYSSFIPTYEMLYLLTYFDQFAPSHRVWSPDSRFILLSGTLSGETQNEPKVYAVDTADATEQAIIIADGVFGIWSFE